VIALALLAAAQTVAPAMPAEDVTVLARKMQMIEVDMKARKPKGVLELYRCRVTRPSGDPELDAVPCETAQACMLTKPTTRKALAACVEQRSGERLDGIASARRVRS
jgi:hypothetical protein